MRSIVEENDFLKFRVWNVTKSAYSKDTHSITSSGTLDVFNFRHVCNDEYLVERCTGVKDTNGYLIYENDIVGVPYTNSEKYCHLGIVSFNNDNYGGVLGWNLVNQDGNAINHYYGDAPTDRHAVLGNVHTNTLGDFE